jgi:hypothetical protein
VGSVVIAISSCRGAKLAAQTDKSYSMRSIAAEAERKRGRAAPERRYGNLVHTMNRAFAQDLINAFEAISISQSQHIDRQRRHALNKVLTEYRAFVPVMFNTRMTSTR